MSPTAKIRPLLAAIAGTAAVALLSAPTALAGAMNLTVGNCQGASYTTIQAAVNAAVPNSHITVCPGTYPEQVNIPAGMGKLVLQGQSKPVVEFPTTGETAGGPNGADAVISISTGAGDAYQLTGFIVQGPWYDGSNGRHFGVYVIGSGSVQINQDTVTNIEDSDVASRDSYDGFAIAIGDGGLFNDGAEVPGNATVNNSVIQSYQQIGVSASVQGSGANLNNDTIVGQQIPGSALLGIVIGDGASASVQNNTVMGNVNPQADPNNDFSQGNGVFVGFAPDSVKLGNNVLSGNDIGLELDGASHVFDGNDKMIRSTFDGIHIDAQDPFGDPTTGNTLSNDQASGSGAYDCEDDTTGSGTAGTANTWMNDRGVTMTPAGICKH